MSDIHAYISAKENLRILTTARQLLAMPNAWTQGAFARDKDGEPCPDTGNDATCFCMWGAVRHARYQLRLEALGTLETVRGLCGGNIPEWNDKPGRTQAEVLSLLDKAVAKLVERIADMKAVKPSLTVHDETETAR